MVVSNDTSVIDPIMKWYLKAQVDYVGLYIQLYISYNAWYCEATGTTNNRQAIGSLKKRAVIWDDYLHGRTLHSLKPYVSRLAEATQHEPFGKSIYWEGYLANTSDWRSLIEFWYQVRCLLVHGSYVSPKLVWLAYETLDAFMSEIIHRMQQSLKDTPKVQGNTKLQRRLYNKYLASPDLWHVDMRRV